MDKLCNKNISKYFCYLILGVTLLFCLTLIIKVQFLTPTLYGADGYQHIRLAEIIKNSGPIHEFPWAEYSIWANRFADKDFLFHLILIPFTLGSNIFLGAKWASVFSVFILLLIFNFVLRKYSPRVLIPLFLLALFLSPAFLQSASETRPMILAIALTLLILHFLMTKNLWGIFIVAAAYSLTHVSGPLLLVYALIVEIIRFFSEKKFFIKTIIITFAGLILACLIHPNFPHNLLIAYYSLVVIPFYGMKWGLELGAEFFPFSTREFLLNYPLVVLGGLGIGSLIVFNQIKIKFETKVLFVVSAIHLFFALLSRRYFFHSYPLIILTFACFISDWLRTNPKILKNRRALIVGLLILCLIIGAVGCYTFQNIKIAAQSEKIVNSHFEKMGNWINQNIPEGELIFHTNWSDPQYFIGLAPKQRYFVTSDPTLMFKWNPQMYNLYRAISFGQVQDPHTPLKETFKVKYGYAGKNYFSGLINQIKQDDEHFEILFEDNLGVIFALK